VCLVLLFVVGAAAPADLKSREGHEAVVLQLLYIDPELRAGYYDRRNQRTAGFRLCIFYCRKDHVRISDYSQVSFCSPKDILHGLFGFPVLFSGREI